MAFFFLSFLFCIHLLACQMRVTVGHSGLCFRVCVTSFECQLTPSFVDSVKTIHCTEREKYDDLTEQTVHQKGCGKIKKRVTSPNGPDNPKLTHTKT